MGGTICSICSMCSVCSICSICSIGAGASVLPPVSTTARSLLYPKQPNKSAVRKHNSTDFYRAVFEILPNSTGRFLKFYRCLLYRFLGGLRNSTRFYVCTLLRILPDSAGLSAARAFPCRQSGTVTPPPQVVLADHETLGGHTSCGLLPRAAKMLAVHVKTWSWPPAKRPAGTLPRLVLRSAAAPVLPATAPPATLPTPLPALRRTGCASPLL